MAWSADVPFPNENTARCRGCGAKIGWVKRQTEQGERPHPVEVRGWAGMEVHEHRRGDKTGYTTNGDFIRVVEPDLFIAPRDLVVCFESHFGFCPERGRFGKTAQGNKRRGGRTCIVVSVRPTSGGAA